MRRRYVLLGLAVVAALSLALPAFGAPSPLSLAKKALKTSKKANRTAKKANRRAGSAKRDATTALTQIRNGVPKALASDNAANADKLDGKDSADFVPGTEIRRFFFKLNAGDPDKEILRSGPLSIYARCTTDNLALFIKTDADGAMFSANEGDSLEGGAAPANFLNATTAEADREWDSFTAGTAGQPSLDGNRIDDGKAVAPDGSGFLWDGENQLIALNYLGSACVVGGNAHVFKVG
jgi:hypothetical protein